MRPSSRFLELGLEGGTAFQNDPKDIDAPAGQSDDGLMMSLSLASFAVVEGTTVFMAQRAERGLVKDALEALCCLPWAVAGSGFCRIVEAPGPFRRRRRAHRRSGNGKDCLPRR
jgi:hypothetical protein